MKKKVSGDSERRQFSVSMIIMASILVALLSVRAQLHAMIGLETDNYLENSSGIEEYITTLHKDRVKQNLSGAQQIIVLKIPEYQPVKKKIKRTYHRYAKYKKYNYYKKYRVDRKVKTKSKSLRHRTGKKVQTHKSNRKHKYFISAN